MITKPYNHVRVLYPRHEIELAEPAICASVDKSPCVVLEQEGRYITVNLWAVGELCKMLKEVAKLAEDQSNG